MTFIRVDGLDSVIRGLDELGSISYRRAAADALTDTAFETRKEESKEVGRTFDGFVSFTERAFLAKRASFKKDPIQAEVVVKDIQARYLTFQVQGGRRDRGDLAVTTRGVMLPVNARLNQAGNFPSPIRFLARSGTTRGAGTGAGSEFVGIPKGRPNNADRFFGIWRRQGRGGRGSITMIAAFRRAVDYKPDRFDFFGVADRTFTKEFDGAFDRRLAEEITKLPPGWSN